MRAFLKKQYGFTLIELLVALAIMGLVLTGVTTVFLLGNNLYNSTNKEFDEHTAALQLEQTIEQNIQYASVMTIYAQPSDLSSVSQTNAIYFDQTVSTPDARGLIIKSGSNTSTFMQGAFKGYTCDVTFTKINNTALQVNITIQKGSDNYTLTKSIPLVNLSVNSSSIGGAATGRLIGFTPYSHP